MIPKLIHCCWLSADRKDALSVTCRRSWERFAAGYEIHEWNLNRWRGTLADVQEFSVPPFVTAALAQRKWAFAADWVRFAALYRFGGIYFDYDFELLKPIDDLLSDGPFVAGQWLPNGSVGMEPAILALEKESTIAKAMLDYYATASFDGKTTVGEILAEMCATRTCCDAGQLRVLPPEVFSPIDVNGVCHLCAETRGIHHYAMSWATPSRRLARWLSWHGGRGLVERLLRLKSLLFGKSI